MLAFRARCILLLLPLVSSLPASAQWVRQSPLPTEQGLWDIVFVSTSTGFIAGESHTLMRTTDGGATWTDVSGTIGASTDPFYALYFKDASTGFVSGNNGVWRTLDGGTTWQQVSTFGGSWSAIDFVSPTEGFVGANGAVIRTVNGGSSFELMSGYPSCPVIYGMDFRDSLVGLAGGEKVSQNQPGIFKTTDGGRSWVRKFTSSANDVVWIDGLTALAAVGSTIYRSTNEGETWTAYGSTGTSGLQDMAVIGPTTIAGITETGEMWLSSDGGKTWSKTAESHGELGFWHVAFLDATHGWFAGAIGAIGVSIDGGHSWAQLSNGTGDELNDIEMVTPGKGLAVGATGDLLRTTNGGAFWERQHLQVTGLQLFRFEDLNAVSFVDEDFAVVAGSDGVVFKTFDGGTAWESIGYPALSEDFTAEGVHFTSRQDGWVAGSTYGGGPSLYHTTDGGNSWTAASTDPVPIVEIEFSGSQQGFAAGLGGRNLRTTNGGATWTDVYLPTYSLPILETDLDFVDASTGWITGWYGLVAKTTNGGASWQYVDVHRTDLNFSGVSAASASEIWITSYQGVVYHTTDGGTTWTGETISAFPYNLYDVHALAGGDAWTVGWGGRVLFHDGGTGPSEPALDVAPIGGPIVLPPSGGTFRYTVSVSGGQPNQQLQVWYVLTRPNGRAVTDGPFSIALDGNGAYSATRKQKVAASSPAGTYTVTGNLGNVYPTPIVSDSFTIQKSAAIAARE